MKSRLPTITGAVLAAAWVMETNLQKEYKKRKEEMATSQIAPQSVPTSFPAPPENSLIPSASAAVVDREESANVGGGDELIEPAVGTGGNQPGDVVGGMDGSQLINQSVSGTSPKAASPEPPLSPPTTFLPTGKQMLKYLKIYRRRHKKEIVGERRGEEGAVFGEEGGEEEGEVKEEGGSIIGEKDGEEGDEVDDGSDGHSLGMFVPESDCSTDMSDGEDEADGNWGDVITPAFEVGEPVGAGDIDIVSSGVQSVAASSSGPARHSPTPIPRSSPPAHKVPTPASQSSAAAPQVKPTVKPDIAISSPTTRLTRGKRALQVEPEPLIGLKDERKAPAKNKQKQLSG